MFNSSDLYYTYETNDKSVVTRVGINELGSLQRMVMLKGSANWSVMYTLVNDQCDSYGKCGPNGVCRIGSSPVCECLKGFVPKSPREWEVLDWRSGCVRKTGLDCGKEVGFMRLENLKLPDVLDVRVNKEMSLKECEAECLKNCSCIAHANSDISNGGTGCLMWFGELIDIREFIEENCRQDIHVKMLATDLGKFAIFFSF